MRTRLARFSPDGNRVVHEAFAAGQPQIVVTSYPDADRRYNVATEYSNDPRWRADGKEIIFRTRDALMSVEIDLDAKPALTIGTPQVITKLDNVRSAVPTPDHQSFLIIRVMQSEPGRAIRIVDNWMP